MFFLRCCWVTHSINSMESV
ncbi:CRISPR-associated DxTHG motif protein, partial [Salmonella enterica]|nr:CRISPR-associated DxTHG motif protein [Salmonella enterica]